MKYPTVSLTSPHSSPLFLFVKENQQIEDAKGNFNLVKYQKHSHIHDCCGFEILLTFELDLVKTIEGIGVQFGLFGEF